MSTIGEQILQQVLALPPDERAQLIERLLETFQTPPDPALVQLWASEVDAYDRGERRREC